MTEMPPPHRRPLALLAGLAVLASTVVALALPGVASASTCGDAVLADWFDNGRIDQVYPLRCYEEAIDSIPADLRDYADAEDVISLALAAAVSGDVDPGTSDPTPRSPSGSDPDPDDPDDPDAGGSTGGGSGGGGSEATPNVDTSAPSSLPVPLLIIAAMSLALLAAGALGYLSRRRHPEVALENVGDDDLAG